ncbi:tyrosine-protein phosphatase [Aromatoleum petrolei]|uniref:Protein-tyrosine-phosphatase n=1 Tax=Aromatoleum petrolei TaxID=76116 RepID=A0ABX1MGV8_9RHOO|nr:tyrosine-protein phosphatase [Aromatoleum petrolei]NMF87018.1 protein-tyrosine-phosphatase [Aromatoleum petrolei]QTQ34752.1 Tyrosine/serine-protein phosphatase [Aromatoleum petrolei]
MSVGLVLTGAPNFRDLGGHPTQDGRRIRRARIFRSGSLSGLTPRDLDAIVKLGIRLICDLRSQAERNAAPNRWLGDHGARELHIDISADLRAGNAELLEILRRDPSAAGARRMMLQTYRYLPGAFARPLRGLFARLVGSDGLPAVFHCTAGKDRTGFLVALLLHALGVERKTIYQDYLASAAACCQRFRDSAARAMAIHLGGALDASAIDVICGVEACYLDESFSAMVATHGSVDFYLENVAGLGPSQLCRLRDALLE